MKRIKYQLMTEINIGTDEAPDIKKMFSVCEILCTADKLAANLALARAEAYNGEVTVDDVPEEASAPTEMEQLRADVDYLLMIQEG